MKSGALTAAYDSNGDIEKVVLSGTRLLYIYYKNVSKIASSSFICFFCFFPLEWYYMADILEA